MERLVLWVKGGWLLQYLMLFEQFLVFSSSGNGIC